MSSRKDQRDEFPAHVKVGQSAIFLLRPEPDALARRGASGPSGSLGCRSFADSRQLEAIQSALRVERCNTRKSAVDHGANAVDRERCLRDIRGENDFTSIRRRKSGELFVAGEASMQGKN